MGFIDDGIDNTFNTIANITLKTLVVTGKVAFSLTEKILSEIRDSSLKRKAARTSEHNRMVFVTPDIDEREIFLSDDVLCDDIGVKNISAYDFISEQGLTPKLIVSGGNDSERSRAFLPFIVNSVKNNIPLLVIHNENNDLAKMTENNFTYSENISKRNNYYHVFGGMQTDDIIDLLCKVMKSQDKNTVPLLRSVIECLIAKEGAVTVDNLAAFSIEDLPDELDKLLSEKNISYSEHDEILSHYRAAGPSSRNEVRVFLNKLKGEFNAIFGTPSGRKRVNFKTAIKHKGAIIINVNEGTQETAIKLMLQHFLFLQRHGRKFNILIDKIPISDFPDFINLLRGGSYSAGHEDFIFSLCGGQQNLLNELMSGGVIILFRNSFNASIKWSEYLGKYKKIEAKQSFTQHGSMLDFSSSKSIHEVKTENPRILSATLSGLPDGFSCISKNNEILIARI